MARLTINNSWKVGRTDRQLMPSGGWRRWFRSERDAVAFIGTLPDHESGVYYLDPPRNRQAEDLNADIASGGAD